MRRVAVIGGSCTGKTTTSRALAARLGVPHIELDALHHDPGWQEAPAEVLQTRVDAHGRIVRTSVHTGRYLAQRRATQVAYHGPFGNQFFGDFIRQVSEALRFVNRIEA